MPKGSSSLMQRERLERFFNELAPRLETARVLDRELDRNLARRFNVLDYLRTNELGLSRIIADLLNPKASHGQGVLFLKALLGNLECFRETLRWPDLQNKTSVHCEEQTTGERRIDVVVRITGPGGETHCLAFENKPYALDQESQVKDYLEHLKRSDRFLLIYLSPRGEGPSELSIPKDELKNWKNRFAIMPYVGAQEEGKDGFDTYRLRHSLADWLGECRKSCEVDRLRWFLADVERFCQGRFGGQAMTTDGEGKAVQEFVLEDPTRIETAAAVYESWPAVKEDVCREFLERLCSAITGKARESAILKDMPVKADREKYWIWMHRSRWPQYEGAVETNRDRRTAILLIPERSGPNDWLIGVASPMPREEMNEGDFARRLKLEKELEAKFRSENTATPWFPWWMWVEEEVQNWDSLVPELYKEKDSGGRITRYFVDEFVRIAEETVPIIDEIEKG